MSREHLNFGMKNKKQKISKNENVVIIENFKNLATGKVLKCHGMFLRHPKFSHGQFGSIEPIRQTPKFLNQLEVTRSGSTCPLPDLVPPKNPENGETGDGFWAGARLGLL